MAVSQSVAPGRSAGARFTALAILLLLIGCGIRLVHITEPPYSRGGMRQYWAALQSREHEVTLGGNSSGFSDTVVRKAAENEIEPPILQWVTAAEWRVTGTESLWFPRVLAIVAWTIGGWFVFLLLRALSSNVAALAGVVVWSFLPYGIDISRSFLPDVPMVACVAAAAFFMVKADSDPSSRNRWLAAGVSALAVFLKLPAIFFIVPVYTGLEFRRNGIKGLLSKQTMLFFTIVILPTFIYYAAGLWVGNWLRGQDNGRVQPHLLLTMQFWKSWAQLVRTNFGPFVVVLGILGVLTARGRALWVAAALGVGYVAFGLVFTFHYMTHTYYHLGLVLVLSVALGLLADRTLGWLHAGLPKGAARVAFVALSALVCLSFFASVFSLLPAPPGALTVVTNRRVPERIGKLVDHSTKVVWVAPLFGVTLRYYGGVAGTDWLTTRPHYSSDLEALKRIRERDGADFFVAMKSRAVQANQHLQKFLARYPILAERPGFVIYDLRGRPV